MSINQLEKIIVWLAVGSSCSGSIKRVYLVGLEDRPPNGTEFSWFGEKTIEDLQLCKAMKEKIDHVQSISAVKLFHYTHTLLVIF